MDSHPYAHLVRYKQWADRGLYEVVGRLDGPDAPIALRILDHMLAVDRIFQCHLQGRPHAFRAPRSDTVPSLDELAAGAREAGVWYVAYVDGLTADEFTQTVEFTFTDGTPARMTRGEIILHVCLHGTYHRGNAGILLQKNGIAPNPDRLTDFLAAAA